MELTPEIIKIQENMKPGVITAEGFLGNDSRNIVEIIRDDEREMTKLGLNFEVVAKKMRELLNNGKKGFELPVRFGKFEVIVYEARGFLPCPFQDGIFRKVIAVVTNSEINKSMTFSELSVHLLEVHHFLQGKGSKFRLEPMEIKEILFGGEAFD
ncbi:hypothetical protein [Thermosipho atlanticus]|uniref:Uncharacterized protein n=1 Tax=Thermosipho atlanticus DSM 15807 TaxID=1123380 RepID=A0A1M5SNI5_9BACT|nr:hypothetical protein [Thermosipho atlanticus]SHH40129.1 hypothetical protein SAMN02745199_0982 [Thermosipho atlanticus DSM 15807]